MSVSTRRFTSILLIQMYKISSTIPSHYRTSQLQRQRLRGVLEGQSAALSAGTSRLLLVCFLGPFRQRRDTTFKNVTSASSANISGSLDVIILAQTRR